MHSFFITPSGFDVVVVTGQDSARFLQGQLTCDVDSLQEAEFRHGAVCNNKGRVLAAFTLVRWQDCWYLCMTAGLGAVLLAALKKYQPFYKCSMQLSAQPLYALAGACAQQALAAVNPAGAVITTGKVLGAADGWFCPLDATSSRVLWLTTKPAEDIRTLLQPAGEGTLEQWEALAMFAGHYPFRATDAEQFTPQELHFDRNGYVSFSKGCYTGQEIVARMHYRGKLKKQLYLLTLDNQHATPSADAPLTLHDAGGAELGHSLVARALGQQLIALASLPVQLAETTTTLFTAEGQPVHAVPFPSP